MPGASSTHPQRPKDEASSKGLASILYKAAWYLWPMGRGHEAQKMAEDAKKLRVKIFGRAQEESQYAIEMLGLAHNLQGHWEAAEKLFVEVMETSKQKLGPDHPDTLTSMANLASTYRNQGRWEAAGKLEVEVMETSKQKLGPDHPSTLTSMNNLAYTLVAQGRQSVALELMRECVRIRRDVLGARHPHYLSSLETLRAWELEHTDTVTTAQRNPRSRARFKEKIRRITARLKM
ncbi:uncharacterized protein PG986_014412 [Apiospora aurea]|uniref:Kinesin light chain n=1 Tax=Apiospora aurea TaxID=335848 RepID=A0ABR1PSX2_9PEZI